MRADTKARILAGRQVTLQEKAAKRSQTIRFGELSVFYFDEQNWCVQKGSDENARWYYPNFAEAVRAVLHRVVGDRVKGDCRAILAAIKEAESAVLSACASPQVAAS